MLLLLGGLGVESVDAAVCHRVTGGRPPLRMSGRCFRASSSQVVTCPMMSLTDQAPVTPGSSKSWLGQSSVGLRERLPGCIKPLHELLSPVHDASLCVLPSRVGLRKTHGTRSKSRRDGDPLIREEHPVRDVAAAGDGSLGRRAIESADRGGRPYGRRDAPVWGSGRPRRSAPSSLVELGPHARYTGRPRHRGGNRWSLIPRVD